jgi:uncharacterized protein YdeI (YjbR/CyaY-like superfamily)
MNHKGVFGEDEKQYLRSSGRNEGAPRELRFKKRPHAGRA